MSVEKKKPMGAYPVTLTDGGFTLNGHEFATKPTLGQRGQNGQRAYAMPVKSGGTGRQFVIVSNGKDRRRLLNPYNFRSMSLGLWQQTEGNPRLARPGLVELDYPTGVATVEALDLTTEEDYGIDRLLGIVAVDSLLVYAAYVGNETLDGYTGLQFRAYDMTGPTLEWTFDVPFTPDQDPTPSRNFRANLYWDVSRRVLSAVDAKIHALNIPSTGDPDTYITSEIDGATKLVSLAGDAGLQCDATTMQVLRRSSASALWQTLGDAYEVATAYPDHAMAWMDLAIGSLQDITRPWPYAVSANEFLCLVLGQRGTVDGPEYVHAFLAASRLGTVTGREILVQGGPWTYLELDTALDLVDTHINNLRGTNHIGDLYAAGTSEAILLTYKYWAGRLDPEGGTIGNALTYACPRKISNLGRTGGFTQTKWPEAISDPDESSHRACLHLDSSDNAIYATIEPVPIIAPGSAANIVEGDSVYDTGDNFHALGPFPNGIQAPAGPGLVEAQVETWSHQPQYQYAHRTVLRKVARIGTPIASRVLSNSFASMTYSGTSEGVPLLPDGMAPVTLTESLPVPENVWQIGIGPAPVDGEEDTPHTDAVFCLQDYRESRYDQPRPCLRLLSSALDITGTVVEIGPTGKITSVPPVDREEDFTGDGETTTWPLSYPDAIEIQSVTVDGTELDGADYSLDAETNSLVLVTAAGLGLTVTVQYTTPGDETPIGDYEWALVCAPKMIMNFGPSAKWALVGVWTQNAALDQRTDLYVVDVADMESPYISNSFTETGATDLPQPVDFNRMTLTDAVRWIGDPSGDGPAWMQLLDV